ncbi:ABC transporter substrate binding protein [Campylobacterota bacterium DY0563]
MDTKRHNTKAHFENLKNVYKEKYKDFKFDVILSSDNNAFDFLKKYNHILFKDTPVVFCGVNNFKIEQIDGYNNFTGVTEKIDIKKNYDLIMKLHPNTKIIYNLVDSTITGISVKKQMQEEIRKYENKNIKFEFLDQLTKKELIDKFRSLPKNSVVLHHSFYTTKDNIYFDHSNLKDFLKKYVNVPIYTASRGLLGNSIIGGYIISGFAQGKTAASMAKQILDGMNISNIPQKTESPNSYIFDYIQIKKFKIDENKLPKDSIYLNKKLSPLELYFEEIITTIIVFILMIIYIITLQINIRKRKKAEVFIRKQLRFQQDLIDNVNTPIYYKNLKKEYIGCNKAFEKLINIPKEDILNKTAYDLINLETAKYFHEQDDILLHTKEVQVYESSSNIDGKGIKDLKFYKNLFYHDGEVGGIVGVIFDITESKALTYELNRTLQTVDKNVIISKTDNKGRIIYVSKAFCEISGYKENELMGKTHTVLTTGLISNKTLEDIVQTISNKQIWSGELLNKNKSGELFTLYTIITPEYDKNGDFINYTAISQDITAKKQIEQAKNEIEKLNIEIKDTQKEVVFRMGAIAEARSKETGQHVKRVAEYSKLLALHYGLVEEEAEILKQASPMHDIGKVAIPDNILKKPGKLTEEEFEVMKTHTTIGYEMLRGSDRPILKTAAIVAFEHQEKYDGSGYPRGLKGENIHIYGRISALADVFDALGSDRCYKKAWEDEKIFTLFKEQKGKHFDPKLIDIFFEHLDEFLVIREKFKDE